MRYNLEKRLTFVFNIIIMFNLKVPQELADSHEEINYTSKPDDTENIDGAPLSDIDNPDNEDLDGVPLDGATLLKHAYDDTPPGDPDIDGVPCKLFFFLLKLTYI